MSKVKKSVENTPKKKSRPASKKKSEETSKTSKAGKYSKSKSADASKKATTSVEVEADSGISSPEKSKRESSSRISKKSKASIVKKSKAVISNKKIGDITWLKGLIQEDVVCEHRISRSKTGIVAHHPRSLSLRKEDGIEYVTFPPAFPGVCSGYVRIDPKLEKAPKKTRTTMNFIILLGKINLVIPDRHTKEYKSGTVITVPKGVRYGLKNTSNEVCFLRFQVLDDGIEKQK